MVSAKGIAFSSVGAGAKSQRLSVIMTHFRIAAGTIWGLFIRNLYVIPICYVQLGIYINIINIVCK
jgi:hypothetical protein